MAMRAIGHFHRTTLKRALRYVGSVTQVCSTFTSIWQRTLRCFEVACWTSASTPNLIPRRDIDAATRHRKPVVADARFEDFPVLNNPMAAAADRLAPLSQKCL